MGSFNASVNPLSESKPVTNLIPIQQRNATREAAQSALDTTLREAEAKAAELVRDARAVASLASTSLQVEAAKADIETRDRVARAFALQVTPLVSELLKHEQLEIAREVCSKYRALQKEALTYCGREFPLMPLPLVGGPLITRAPEKKSRISRLGTFGGFDAYSAAAQIAAMHAALMSSGDPRGVREAVFALERRLVEIGNTALPGAFSDAIWESLKRGLGFYEIDEITRDLSQPKERATLIAAAAEYRPPHKVSYGGFLRAAIMGAAH